MPRTPVYIICSTRPQVGKTLMARLLTEFLKLQRGGVTAFDVSLKEPSLLDFLPRLTETADIDDTFGKMALMDRLIVHDDMAKVIDLGYHAFDEFFRMTAEIGFAKEAARRGVAPIVLFMGDSDRASLRAYTMLQQQYPQRALYVIDNEQVLRGEIPPVLAQGKMLHVAALPPFLKTYIDRLNFSFTGYLRSEHDSSTELHQWIRRNYFAFREIELGLLLM
ncbi:hypothetical protein E0H22_20495 [Rhodopseudomonas boonkerdii]|uniref:hypothetical protein n=1 Tax=Rhodopseudomonas boonkerdii TaxID=475937 RepID=UPI001E5D1C70|nr:hypothetical protein [Rhodopseudomonas boonkerdii]UGV27847.1 hypothetical protein E0H22_20495 [Rhodopseudomonas boonkerdii]